MGAHPPNRFIRQHKAAFGLVLGLACMGFAWLGTVSNSTPVLEEQANPPVALSPPAEPVPAALPETVTFGVKRLPASTLSQGQSVVVTVTAPDNKAPASLTLGKRSARFFKQDTPHTWQAVVGLSVDEATGPTALAVTQGDGSVLHHETVTLTKTSFGRQNINVSSKTGGLQPIPGELEAIGQLKTTLTPIRYWSMPFESPTPDCQNSPFGTRRYHNGTYTGDYHKGVDLRSPAGRPIKAIAGGKVQIATLKYRLHGGTVGLDHGQGFTSIYIHMSKVLVKPGDLVKKGQVIGHVGSSGFATGPHLHWGLYANGVPVNPNQLITYHRC
ncbi:MAG: M23 family metallopeptidase [Cyanobacteria bacterium HKST-UBA06]|nr:M23 family metallopeptidase [Cyanobacteria bacterium HKST-UBA06]